MYNEKSRNLLVRKRMIDSAEGRLISVTEEFSKAFDILEQFEYTVSIFGSARVLPTNTIYKSAYKVAQSLANRDYVVITGGGGGVMEAANRGAYEASKPTVGFNIELPTEQQLNKYTTHNYSFEHFFGRKVALTLNANAYIFFPGGFGTMDELFEILTLVQSYIVPRVPIIMYDSAFWQPFAQFINDTLDRKYNTISSSDQSIYQIVDSIDEVVKIVENHKEVSIDYPEASIYSNLIS